MYRTVPYTKYIYRICNINNIAMYVYSYNFHSKHLRSCRLPTFLLTWSDCKTFINIYIYTYVCMYVENYHVDNYFSKITMYYFILPFTVCTIILLIVLINNFLFHRQFPWCRRWWTQQSDIARSNFSIYLIVSRVLSSR